MVVITNDKKGPHIPLSAGPICDDDNSRSDPCAK